MSFHYATYAHCCDELTASTLIANKDASAGNLLQALDKEFANPALRDLDIICAFINSSGVKLLTESPGFLSIQSSRRVRVRIITTTYLGFTSKAALEDLADALGAQIVVHCASSRSSSFHTKGWRFKHGNACLGVAIVGSSNISESALKTGYEWNVHLPRSQQQALQKFDDTFDSYWLEASVLGPLSLFRHYNKDRVEDSAWLDFELRKWRGIARNLNPADPAAPLEVSLDQPDMGSPPFKVSPAPSVEVLTWLPAPGHTRFNEQTAKTLTKIGEQMRSELSYIAFSRPPGTGPDPWYNILCCISRAQTRKLGESTWLDWDRTNETILIWLQKFLRFSSTLCDHWCEIEAESLPPDLPEAGECLRFARTLQSIYHGVKSDWEWGSDEIQWTAEIRKRFVQEVLNQMDVESFVEVASNFIDALSKYEVQAKALRLAQDK